MLIALPIASVMTTLELAGVGLCAGVFGGMLGVGGSIVMIPAMMLLLGPDLHVYQGAAMIVNFFVSLPAAWQHHRCGAVLPGVVRAMIPAAVAGVLAGVWLSESRWFRGVNEVYLSRVFGVFLWYVAGQSLFWVLRRSFDARAKRPATNGTGSAGASPIHASAARVLLAVGLPTGFIGGLLGVGGGIIAVPLQQLFLRMPIRNAIANSSATIVGLSCVGAFYKNVRLVEHVPLTRPLGLAAVLIPTAFVGGLIGARITHWMPTRVLRLVIAALMAYAGTKLFFR